MRLLRSIVVTVALSVLAADQAVGDELYDALKNYFKQSFPGKAYTPTPFGADTRYAPKTIWVRVEALKDIEGVRTRPAWVPHSSGAMVYTGTLVPLLEEEIDLKVSEMDTQTRLALAASLNKALGPVTAMNLGAEWSKDLEVDINLGKTMSVWGYYDDFLIAQDANPALLDAMNQRLRARYNKLPDTFTVVAAIKVDGATVSVKKKTGAGVSIGEGVISVLSKIGFSWNRDKAESSTLKISGNKYIAFEALKGREGLRISSLEAPAEQQMDYATSEEAAAHYRESAGQGH